MVRRVAEILILYLLLHIAVYLLFHIVVYIVPANILGTVL